MKRARESDSQFTALTNVCWRYKFLVVLILLFCIVYFNLFRIREHGTYLASVRTGIREDECLEGTKYVEENFETLDQHDPKLVKYVRTRYLIPPSNQPYQFNNPDKIEKTDNGNWVRKYLKEQRNGVFIEAGANEGERHSHTLGLEMDLGWSGLLIECNPTVTPYLRTKRRKAWVAGVCISTTAHPAVLNFSNPEKWTYSGRLGPAWKLPGTNWTYFDVESVPLYTIIAAAGLKEIDFFSFDVEGVEADILKHFPFDKVKIKLMIMEVQFISQEKRNGLEKFLNSKGFIAVEKQGMDYIFVHKDHIKN